MPKVVFYSKGSIIFFQGDTSDLLFILKSGGVVLNKIDITTGNSVNDPIKTGEFFGVKSALARKPRMETANVIVDSQVIQLTVQEFEKIFASNKQVTYKMLRVFSKNLRELHVKLADLLHQSVAKKDPVEGLKELLEMFYKAGDYKESECVINRLLTYNDDSVNKEELEGRLKEIQQKQKESEENAEMTLKGASALDESEEISPVIKQFELPIFERFTKNFTRGEVIVAEYEKGDSFYFIKSGGVDVVKNIEGTKKNLDVMFKGEFFGEMAILDDSPRGATCVARDNVTVLEFNKENFDTIVSGNPLVVISLLKIFCTRVYNQYRKIKNYLIKDAGVKVADVFLMYEEMNPVVQDKSDGYDGSRKFNLTVNDVSNWCGLATETVRDELDKLIKGRKIEMFDNYMVVKNIQDFKRTVDSYYQNLK